MSYYTEICRMKVHWVDSKKHSPQSFNRFLCSSLTHECTKVGWKDFPIWKNGIIQGACEHSQQGELCVLLATLLRPMSYLRCFWSNKNISKHLEQIPSSDKHKENSCTKKTTTVKLLNSPASKSSSSAAIVIWHWIPFALSFKGFQ